MILAINPGSSSLKATLFDGERQVKTWKESLSGPDDFERVLGRVLQESFGHGELAGVGCRVVDGGPDSTESVRVNAEVLDRLENAAELAPLHSKESLDAIHSVQKLAANVPIVAAFDTTFHRTIPAIAATYALPAKLRNELRIKRYGFHGLAYQSVVRSLSDAGHLPTRLVACQLGSGSSACAILNGESVDTTMGLTPLEGLVMGSRSGSVDPGILLFLLRNGYDADSLSDLLNKKSGLLGLSEISSDVQKLEASEDPKAAFALEVFAYSAAKHIGALAVSLGGIDALAFSGGIGEHSSHLRQLICEYLEFLDFGLEPNENELQQEGARIISVDSSKPIWIVPASEEREIAREVDNVLAAG